MNATRWFSRGILCAACVIALTAPGLARAEPTFHVLVVADTLDPSIGRSVKIDAGIMRDVFEANVPERQLQLTTLIDRDASSAGLLGAVEKLKPGDDDVTVVYFSGHGGYNAQLKEHMVFLRGETLGRKKLAKALKQRGGRHQVILTDTCSNVVDVPIPAPWGPPPENVTPLFRSLFMEPRGFTDVSATQPGEFGQATPGGGVFTIALKLACIENPERRFDWTAFLKEINRHGRRMNPNQTACFVAHADDAVAVVPPVAPAQPAPNPAIPAVPNPVAPGQPAPNPALPVVPGPPRIRLGVAGIDNELGRIHGGVAIHSVFAGAPATRVLRRNDRTIYSIAPGRDVITHVNGQKVTTKEDLVREVGKSPRELRLTIYDNHTRVTDDYFATLPN